MNIAIVHPELSRTGGIERASAELALGAVAAGHEVHFYGVRDKMQDHPGIQFHTVNVFRKPHALELASFAIAARRELRRRSHNIVQSYGSIIGSDLITAQSCHLAGLQTVDLRVDDVEGTSINWGVADRIRLILERQNYARRKYGHVIAVSEGVKQELITHYNIPDSDVTVIPNGVDLRSFSPEFIHLRRSQARSKWGFSEADYVALFVGNEFGRKGLKPLISALSVLPDLPMKLLVVGMENPVPYIQYASSAGVAGRVRFAGVVEDMPGAYAAGDAFVLPSDYEAFPLALLEAAASGLPIVITRVHGANDLIKEGENGLFVEREPYAIADSLSMLMHNRALAQKLGENARESVQQYSWTRIVPRTLEIYEMVLRRKNSSTPR